MSRSVFGRFEVESCKKVELSATGCIIETCEDDEAEFYSIYRRNKNGFADCLMDFDDRRDAEDHAKILNKNDEGR